MGVIIPFFVSTMLLGRAFDMKKMQNTATVIFDDEIIQSNLVSIKKNFISSQYRMVDSSSEANDFIDVGGELALKVKAGNIDVEGSGKYLKKTIDREKTVEIILQVYHEIVTDTFPTYINSRNDWKLRPPNEVGTHYIRSMTYGGQLLISYQLVTNSSEYMEDIRAAVNANLQISGSLDVGAKGDFEKLSKAVEGKCKHYLSVYATAGAISPPDTLEAAMKLVEDYPDLVKKINNGKGSPLKVELLPLSTLHTDFEDYIKNNALNGLVEDATNKYDDIRCAENEYIAWDDQLPLDLPDDQKTKIAEFYDALTEARDAMISAITKLDASKDGSLTQFDDAFQKYGSGDQNIPNRYMRWLSKLQHEVSGTPFKWSAYTKGVTNYVHWGSPNCTLPSPEPVYIGYAAASPVGFGNGGNLLCLPKEAPQLDTGFTSLPTVSKLTGVKYLTPENNDDFLTCAFCRLENATIVSTIPGLTECPKDTKLEYSGYLISSKETGTASDFVCLDKSPAPRDKDQTEDPDAGVFIPVWVDCPDCPDSKKQFVPCVVCSR